MFRRFRRLRTHKTIRDMTTQTRLHKDDFVYPLFVKEGRFDKIEVLSMPGVYQMDIDTIVREVAQLVDIGIKAVLLFGIPDHKDEVGSECMGENSLIARTIMAIKKKFPDIYIITDLCFCEYTSHGHCGVLDETTGAVDNDKTLANSSTQALVHVKAGADMIAPSGMMDGIVATLRHTLDTHGYTNIPIMSYSTKFASAFYGPFRDVAQSSPDKGDRKSYQMSVANRLEAIEESLEDELQGADMLMVKPALSFLDIIRDIKNSTNLPIVAYNVSGEYAMLKLAGAKGLIDYDKVMFETLLSMKRAGASIIITYHAKEICKLLDR